MRVWVAGLTIGGAVNKAQNSTVSAFLYAVPGTSTLLARYDNKNRAAIRILTKAAVTCRQSLFGLLDYPIPGENGHVKVA